MSQPRKRRAATARRTEGAGSPDACDVAAFLADNPDWLARNPEVLDAITPDHRELGEGVVDIQGVLIDRLRVENAALRTDHDALLQTTRANLAAQGQIHGAVLSLLEARSFRELIEVATTDLGVKLDVDVVVLAVENTNGVSRRSVADIRLLPPGSVSALMGEDREVVLRADARSEELLYEAGRGLVASEALIRLHASPDSPPGILALGSRRPGHFIDGQGTELLAFLGRVLELSIRTWLGLPRT